jgi:16S rRNA (guanine966-N2)-methyltransferase
MRIISGTNRGGKLLSPDRTSVRPTRNMVKAALFNMIRPSIEGSRFIDLFSGSGAVGIQALCEGAEHVFFIEKNARCVEIIKKNVFNISSNDKATIVKAKAEAFIQHHDLSFFDFLFMDPPYFYTIEQYCTIIETVLGKIKKTALFFMEYTSDYDLNFLNSARHLNFRENRYGNTKLGILTFNNEKSTVSR